MENQQLVEINLDSEIDIIKSNVTPILNTHRERVRRALNAGSGIIKQLEAAGGEITQEIDANANNYLLKIGIATKELLTSRQEITQAFDLLKKQFTEGENSLDAKKAGTIPYKIQVIRNEYAKQCAEKEKMRLAEIAKQARKKEEGINIKKEIELQLSKFFNTYLLNQKITYTNKFNSITLESFESETKWFENYKSFAYKLSEFQKFAPKVIHNLHTEEEYSKIFVSIMNDQYPILSETYKSEMLKTREEIVIQFQSKQNELIKIAEFEAEQIKIEEEKLRIEKEKQTANAARQKELEALRLDNEVKEKQAKEQAATQAAATKERERIENERIAAEQAAKEKETTNTIELAGQQASILSMFEGEVEKSINAIEQPKMREGFEIKVHDISAYLELFTYWYKDEGVGLTVEKMDKKLDFVRKYAEKIASKDESKIIKSKSFSYEPIYKAINK